jgi:hypothetical protein
MASGRKPTRCSSPEPRALKHLGGVGRHLHAGADFAEGGGALEQAEGDAALAQRTRERDAADAAADDADPNALLIRSPSHVGMLFAAGANWTMAGSRAAGTIQAMASPPR